MTTTRATRRPRPRVTVALVLSLVTVVGGAIARPAPAGATVPVPAAPSNLAFSTASNGDTTFTWTATPGTYGHELWCERDPYPDGIRRRSGGDPQNTATLRLPAGEFVLCVVRAYNLEVGVGFVYSDYSNFVTVQTAPVPKPTGVHAVPYSGQVTVTWTKPADDLVDGWKVEAKPSSETHQVSKYADATSVVFTTLAVNTPYTFSVTPFRTSDMGGSKDGPPTAAAENPVTIHAVPSAPTITEMWSAAHRLELSWSPPAFDGGSPITSYQIYGDQLEWNDLVFEVPASITHLVLDGEDDVPGLNEPDLPSGIEFTSLTIRARTAYGYGTPGAWPGGSVFLYDPPSPVQNLFVRQTPGYPLMVDWDEPASVPSEIPAGSETYRVEFTGPESFYDDVTQTQKSVGDPLDPGWYQVRVRMTGGLSPARWASRWFAVGTPCDPSFTDVTGAPFCTPISWLVRQGIATGYPGNLFKPTASVTRQAMAAFLYRAQGSPLGANPTCASNPFPDVPTSSPFCGVIKWMVDEHITAGYADGGFHPADPVSRQATAAFLYRAGSQTRANPTPTCSIQDFADVPIASPFCGYISWMVDASVTSGYADGGFHPAAAVTRQAMAAFLYRWHP